MSETNTFLRLPRDENGKIKRRFKGRSGQEYIIRTQEEGIGIDRKTLYDKMMPMLHYGMTYQGIFNSVKQAQRMLTGEGSLHERNLKATLFLESITGTAEKLSQTTYSTIYEMCSLFIVTPDEQLDKWIQEEQNDKIEDWNIYHEDDFFLLLLNSIPDYMIQYRELISTLKEVGMNSVESSGLKEILADFVG